MTSRIHSWFTPLLGLLCAVVMLAGLGRAQTTDPANLICPRYAPGAVVTPPPDLFSQNGVLTVNLTFQTTVDEQGLVRYCYITDTGLQAPTLHVNPGDQLIINFHNELPSVSASALAAAMKKMHMHSSSARKAGAADDTIQCADGGVMTAATTNLHFHGTNAPPVCGQDDVLHTMIQPGSSFTYDVQIPTDEPPGLYWYHPHPHGFSEGQVQGGAAGALIVEGIQNVNTALAGLPQRLFVVRDQVLPNSEANDANIPAWDVSLNYVPVTYPNYQPAVVQTPAGEKEFWRILNAAADTILDVQYIVNGAAQPVQVVAIDGYPIGGGGTPPAPQSETETSLLLPPGARAEIVVTTPNVGDQAQLTTQYWNTGPDGDYDPTRPLANIVAQAAAQPTLARLAKVVHPQTVTRFADLVDETPVAQRSLAFSEVLQDPTNPNSPTSFFITVAGQTPAVFTPGQAPNVIVHQGTVEDWTVENTALEDHIFHIHQLHFQVMAINGQPVNDPAVRDTIDLPYWSGSGPYPSATLRMDFRDPSIIGTFVYHCHILAHEDGGMMGEIQVLPPGIATATSLAASSTDVNLNASVTFTATITPASAGAALSGTVQFAEDGANLGAAVPVASGQAALTVPMSAAGNHTITAVYSGDTNYDGSVSAALPVGVEDFTLSAAATAAVPAPGQSATAAITIAGSANFTAVINLACSVPAALTEAACFVNPNSLTGGGQATLTVNTSPPHALLLPGLRLPGLPPGGAGRALVAGLALLLACGFWMLRRPSASPSGTCGAAAPGTASIVAWRVPVVVGMFVLAMVAFSGCGGGSSSSDPGTPAGVYNVVVTGSSGSGAAAIQHTLVVPITVQ